MGDIVDFPKPKAEEAYADFPSEAEQEQIDARIEGVLHSANTQSQYDAAVEAKEVADRQAATNAIREAAVAAQQPPMMTQKYIASGLVGGEKISQEFQIHVPQGMPDHDQANLMLWDAISRVGGLTVKVNDTHYKLYPIKMFDGALDLEVSIVTGNSIV